MNRLIKIIVVLLESFLCYIFFIKEYSIGCLFKTIFNISCFSCGLTRGFKEIIKLNFIESFNYNLLSIPIFFLLIYINLLLISDIIFDKKILNNYLKKIGTYYKEIIVIILINTIINNLRGI